VSGVVNTSKTPKKQRMDAPSFVAQNPTIYYSGTESIREPSAAELAINLGDFVDPSGPATARQRSHFLFISNMGTNSVARTLQSAI
jgi:hypothetical protein